MDDKRVNIGIIGPSGAGKVGKSLESLYLMGALARTFSEPIDRPMAKKCTRAKGNTGKYGKKCKHGGSCDGYKSQCRFATY